MDVTEQNKRQDGPLLDEQLAALANADRRRLLIELFEARRRGETPIETIETETGDPAESIAMYHRHLPNLEDLGFVSWDRTGHLVTAGPHFREIEPLLDVLVTGDDDLPFEFQA